MRQTEIEAELRRRLPVILPVKNVRWGAPKARADSRFDLSASVSLCGRPVRVFFEVAGQPNLAVLKESIERIRALPRNEGALALVVAPHFSREMRDLCRRMGQPYLDLSGNAWLERGSILIEKEVSRNLYPHEARQKSPFADRASLVLRHLLGEKSHQGAVRSVARAVGLSPGYVSKVVGSAVEHGYVRRLSRGRVELKNLRELLADWSAFYSWKKNKARRFYCRLERVEEVYSALRKELAGRDDYALSLHVGNNLIHPHAAYSVWHIYARSPEPVDRLKKVLDLEPADEGQGEGGANFFFLDPYYRDSAWHGARVVRRLRIVSDLQLYLDLRRYPVRGEEAAENILSRRLVQAWGLKRS